MRLRDPYATMPPCNAGKPESRGLSSLQRFVTLARRPAYHHWQYLVIPLFIRREETSTDPPSVVLMARKARELTLVAYIQPAKGASVASKTKSKRSWPCFCLPTRPVKDQCLCTSRVRRDQPRSRHFGVPSRQVSLIDRRWLGLGIRPAAHNGDDACEKGRSCV